MNTHSLSWLGSRAGVIGAIVVAMTASGSVAFARGGGQQQTGPPMTAKAQAPDARVQEEQPASSDEGITQAIERRFEAAPGVPSYMIHVATKDGVVTLSGDVYDLLARDQAGRLAATIRGVRDVRNRISVPPTERAGWQTRIDVEDALGNATALEGQDIRVKVYEGYVTLSGTVGSWPEKHLATLLTERVWGVRGVDNKLRVAYGVARSDAEILADIQSRMHWDPWLKTPELKVHVTGGKVQLTGLVESAAARDRVYQDGWVSGVRAVDASGVDVVPNVQVAMNDAGQAHPTAMGGVSDAELQRLVAEGCHYDPLLASANLKVQAQNGVVALNGTVDNLEARHVADEIAQEFAVAAKVRNFIKVHPIRTYSDQEIQRNVEQAFGRDSQLKTAPITVSVNNGQVALSGRVDAGFQRSRAALLASIVPGVTGLKNDIAAPELTGAQGVPAGALAVSASPASDGEIKQDIEEQLHFDPLVNAKEVTVRVKEGVATLTGMVDTTLERRAAIQCAREGGALKVQDELNVRGGSPAGPAGRASQTG